MPNREQPPSIYRTPEAEVAVRRLYERTRLALPFATGEQVLDTTLGPTHVLTAGRSDGPTVVFLQGGNVVNPITLGWLGALVPSHRIVAPDTPGQPGLSHPHRPDDAAAYGRWVGDVLDGAGLRRATLIGVSQGAGVALRFAAHSPSRIDRLVLVVPAGLVSSPPRAMLRLTAGYIGYRLFRRRSTVAGVARALTGGNPPDAALVDAIALSFGGTTLEPDLPLATASELRSLTAPVLVLAGERDPLFPPARVLPRARVLFPTLAAAEVIPGAGHILGADGVSVLGRRLDAFLSAAQVAG